MPQSPNREQSNLLGSGLLLFNLALMYFDARSKLISNLPILFFVVVALEGINSFIALVNHQTSFSVTFVRVDMKLAHR